MRRTETDPYLKVELLVGSGSPKTSALRQQKERVMTVLLPAVHYDVELTLSYRERPIDIPEEVRGSQGFKASAHQTTSGKCG